ncbi:MAG: hypothetical protein PF482_03350 [Desulfobacteraceae bacterium]|jgi:hypothetical protein|nr:hypothetical protein [Desulfobacteraceae bacterium]
MSKDIPIKEIVIEWHFEPKDYFEEKVLIEYEDFNIIIDSGNAEARIPPKYFNSIDVFIDKLTHDLESHFLGAQVISHQTYKLSDPKRYDLREDGGKNMYVKAGPFVGTGSFGQVEWSIKDSKGNIIRSSKRERIDKKKWFAEASTKYRIEDKVLDQMLKSYAVSVSDPMNELIHLYEIREAACAKFGRDKITQKSLNITHTDWNFLGRIANHEPFIQGRHRGQNPGKLRDASQKELQQAREVAKKIIEQYMKHLEKQSDL